MKSQVLHTVWCYISGEASGEIWHWSLIDQIPSPWPAGRDSCRRPPIAWFARFPENKWMNKWTNERRNKWTGKWVALATCWEGRTDFETERQAPLPRAEGRWHSWPSNWSSLGARSISQCASEGERVWTSETECLGFFSVVWYYKWLVESRTINVPGECPSAWRL